MAFFLTLCAKPLKHLFQNECDKNINDCAVGVHGLGRLWQGSQCDRRRLEARLRQRRRHPPWQHLGGAWNDGRVQTGRPPGQHPGLRQALFQRRADKRRFWQRQEVDDNLHRPRFARADADFLSLLRLFAHRHQRGFRQWGKHQLHGSGGDGAHRLADMRRRQAHALHPLRQRCLDTLRLTAALGRHHALV